MIITAESDRFLYNMMRLLSGTLVQAAAAWLAGPGRGLDEARCKNTTTSHILKNKKSTPRYSFFWFYETIVFLHWAPSGPRTGPRPGHGWASCEPRRSRSLLEHMITCGGLRMLLRRKTEAHKLLTE